MVQRRIHDYRGPRSSENLNGHLAGLLPAGVYEGLQVSPDGTISAGWLLTAEGVRIEEESEIAVLPPAGDATHGRYDLIVCNHEFERTVPAPVATFEVVEGTPAALGYPDLPEFCTLVAQAYMPALGTEWSIIIPMTAPIRVHNAVQVADGTWTILHGASGALLFEWFASVGFSAALVVYMVRPGTLSDGDPITWGDPVFTIRGDGRVSCEMVDCETVRATDGDFGGDVEVGGGLEVVGSTDLQGAVQFDAHDADDVAFDDWVTFTRWIQPCQGNSDGWENLGFAWRSVTDITGKVLYLPIHGIVGAELVSIDVGLESSGLTTFNVEAEYASSPISSLVAGNVEFGAVTISVPGGTNVVTNVPLVDPSPPNVPLPWAFDDTNAIWLKLKTGGADIFFTGAKLNYRRKKILV